MSPRTSPILLDRDVRSLLDASGLGVTSLETYDEPTALRPAGSCFEGRATA